MTEFQKKLLTRFVTSCRAAFCLKKVVSLPLHCILEADGSLATPLLRTLVAGTGPAHPHRIAARAPRRPRATYHRSVHVWRPQRGMVVS